MISERDSLPVKKFQNDIMDAVRHNPVVIIRGATGCGKTTQVPQYILDEFILNNQAAQCNIVVTQVKIISILNFTVKIIYEALPFFLGLRRMWKG